MKPRAQAAIINRVMGRGVIILLEEGVTREERAAIEGFLLDLGARPRLLKFGGREAIETMAGENLPSLSGACDLKGIDRLLDIPAPFVLASKAFKGGETVLEAGDVKIGRGAFSLIAGPCAVESREQMEACAAALKAAGARLLRGGSFKPRTSPYSFQGLGEDGLKIHKEVADRHGLLVLSEVLDRMDLPVVSSYADVLQVGSRNMNNYPLLKALGRQEKPVLLKRGQAATREEFLLAAEYILQGGNGRVVLCERGVRTFDRELRNNLDLASVCLLKEQTHLPVIVDPSHGTGRSSLVVPMARAAVAAGADGLLVEFHPDPKSALSDAKQALAIPEFIALAAEIEAMVRGLREERE